ncbi:MAG: biotin transporter BioY, partial [bacterium]
MDYVVKGGTLAGDVLLILSGSVFIGLMAQISFVLPFTPVPITGQTFAVLSVGALLGSRRGVLTVAVYLMEGILGLPFFAGGSSGLARLLGPTGGYLIGFLPCAWVTGYLCERGWDRKVRTAVLAMLAGILEINPELYEAAALDGVSSRWQEIFYITIPSMKPQMLFGAVMAIVGTFQAGAIGVT